MKIDIHNHPNYYGRATAKQMIENMELYGIDKTWLLSCEAPEGEWNPDDNFCLTLTSQDGPTPFRNCIDYYKDAPDRFILGYCPDPRKPDAIDKLSAAIDAYDVRVCGELKMRFIYDNPDALELYRFCGEKKLPVLMHIDYAYPTGRKYPRSSWWYGGGIEALERAAKACPETNFVGHAPGFWAHISGDEKYKLEQYPKGELVPGGKLSELLRNYPNVYCDISAGSGCGALSRDKGFTEEFLTEFSDRVMYGRDCFDNRHQELLSSLSLGEDILAKIYYKNALKLTGFSAE